MPQLALNTLNYSAALIMGAALLLGSTAWADAKRFTATDPAWKTECGSCHVPYPPALLPAASWRAIMSGLNQHFGTDASLEPQVAAGITAFLVEHAGRDRGSAHGQPILRITETAWFKHEHEEELPAAIWSHPAVKSPANCGACHTRAADGDYSEASRRVPR